MNLLGVTFIAVSKVIVAVLVGVFTTSSIPHSAKTLRDFAYLISTILLTSLTLSNTAKSIDLDVLFRCSILILFSLFSIACGLLWGVLFGLVFFRPNPKYSGIPPELRKDVRLDLLYDRVAAEDADHHGGPLSSPATTHPGTKKKKKKRVPYVAVVLSEHFREAGVNENEIVNALEVTDERQEDYGGYNYASWVACSTQNGVTLPLSLMLNVASSVPYINKEHTAAYIFVFSISYLLYLWSACPIFVEAGQRSVTKQRLIREILQKHKRMMSRCDATTQTLSLPVKHVPENEEDSAEDVRVDGSATGTRQTSSLEPQCTRFIQPLAASAAASGGIECSDNTSGLEAGDGAARDALDTRVSVRVDSATYTLDPITPLQNSFTQTDRKLTHTGGKRAGAEVISNIPGTPTPADLMAAECAYTMASAVQLPYDWATAGFIRVKYESEIKALKKKSISEKIQHLGRGTWGLIKKAMTSPPFLATVLGIVIGIIPPVRRLFTGGPLEMVMDAIALMGEGSIPASLLLLGANLVGSSSTSDSELSKMTQVRLRHAEQNTEYPLHPEVWRLLGEDATYARWYDDQHIDIEFDMHRSFSLHMLMQGGPLPASTMPSHANAASVAPMTEYGDEEGGGEGVGAKKKRTFMGGVRRTLSLRGIRPSFVWGIITFRMLISPTLSFFLLVFLIKTMPFLFGGRGTLDKTLIMVLMVELAAPTAINSTLLFNAYQFMMYPWAKMLFLQYILCVVSMVMWTTIGLSYVSSL
ncbi:putative Membrane transport protein [Leishmania naiffi]|uniref:Membrane transport protein n=1 Tax=Leishmania naiffi TaxID=5678 RepID=A0AAW3C196_9TRYP